MTNETQDKRIVIIDDDAEFLEELRDALSGGSYDVTTVSDPALALEVIRRVKPSLILLDLNMPKKNGFRLVKEIRKDEEYHDVPIAVLSAMTDMPSKYLSAKCGAEEFFEKPVEIDRLKLHIKDILNKKA